MLIVDEPTRGIDIGTKGQIYRFIADLAARGSAVIVISSEMQELIGLCHRILVMRGGRIVAALDGEDMTEDRIVIAATGVARSRPHERAPRSPPRRRATAATGLAVARAVRGAWRCCWCSARR